MKTNKNVFKTNMLVIIAIYSVVLTGCSKTVKVESKEQTLEKLYIECQQLKNDIENFQLEYFVSFAKNPDFFNPSQETIEIQKKYQNAFDRFQILQCVLNFPVLEDKKLDPSQIDSWNPSAIV